MHMQNMFDHNLKNSNLMGPKNKNKIKILCLVHFVCISFPGKRFKSRKKP